MGVKGKWMLFAHFAHKSAFSCRWESFTYSQSSWYHHTHTHPHICTHTYRHLSLQNILFFIILSSNTFASWDNSHLTNAAVCVQNTPTMSHPEKVGKKAMHEFLYRNTYTPRKSHLKKLCALWQWYKKRLLFSEWEGTCGWCKIEALFTVHAPCWSL